MGLEESIRDSYLAQGFSQEQLEAVYQVAQVKSFEDGEVLLRQFDETRDLYILTSGRAHILTMVGDAISTIKPGMPIGEVSFLDGKPRSVSVISVGPSEAVVLPYHETWGVLRAHPEMELTLLRNISQVLCARLRSANKNIAALLAIEESETAAR
jgi:CRP-like cAMP-binding protein